MGGSKGNKTNITAPLSSNHPAPKMGVSITPKPAAPSQASNGRGGTNSQGGVTANPNQAQLHPRIPSTLTLSHRASLPPTLSITPVSAPGTRPGFSPSQPRSSAPSTVQIRPTGATADKRIPPGIGRNSPDVGGNWPSSPPTSRYAPPPSVTTQSAPTPYSPYAPPHPERYPVRPNFHPSFNPGSPHIRGDPRHSLPPARHPAYGSIMGQGFPPQGHPASHTGMDAYNRARHPHPMPQVYRGMDPVSFSPNMESPRLPAAGAQPPLNHPQPPSHTQPINNRKDLPQGNAERAGSGEFSSGLMSYFSSQRDENAD